MYLAPIERHSRNHYRGYDREDVQVAKDEGLPPCSGIQYVLMDLNGEPTLFIVNEEGLLMTNDRRQILMRDDHRLYQAPDFRDGSREPLTEISEFPTVPDGSAVRYFDTSNNTPVDKRPLFYKHPTAGVFAHVGKVDVGGMTHRVFRPVTYLPACSVEIPLVPFIESTAEREMTYLSECSPMIPLVPFAPESFRNDTDMPYEICVPYSEVHEPGKDSEFKPFFALPREP